MLLLGSRIRPKKVSTFFFLVFQQKRKKPVDFRESTFSPLHFPVAGKGEKVETSSIEGLLLDP